MDAEITPATPIRLRVATNDDADAIVDIWRKGLKASLGFQAELPEAEPYFSQCIQEQSGVAIDHVGKIVGWQSLRPTRANPIMRSLRRRQFSLFMLRRVQCNGLARSLPQLTWLVSHGAAPK
jgi:hypothetical protein